MKSSASAAEGATDTVTKWLSQKVFSGFEPGGAAKMAAQGVGLDETWCKRMRTFCGKAIVSLLGRDSDNAL